MPTYAYRCDACGTARDEWLKMSEAQALRDCPSCGQASYRKQVSAPAFQLKGSGWYVTDFKQGAAKPPASSDATKADAAAKPADAAPSKDNASKASDTGSATPASTTPSSKSSKPAS